MGLRPKENPNLAQTHSTFHPFSSPFLAPERSNFRDHTIPRIRPTGFVPAPRADCRPQSQRMSTHHSHIRTDDSRKGASILGFQSTDTLACQLLRSDGSRAESAPPSDTDLPRRCLPKQMRVGGRDSRISSAYTRVRGLSEFPWRGKIFPEHLRTEPRTGPSKLTVTMAVRSALVAPSASARWDGDTRL